MRPADKTGFLALSLTGVETPALFEAVQRTREMFDLDAPVAEIRATLEADPELRERLRVLPGPRVTGAWDGFELTVRAILGQQVSVAAATTLAGRIAAKYGEPLDVQDDTSRATLSHLFPTAAKLSRARFAGVGLTTSRAETIRGLARAVVRGDVHFDFAQDVDEFCAALKAIKGIGDWTAQYVAMRVLKNPDAFPASDLGLLKAIDAPQRMTPRQLEARAEAWRPWRAYAAMLLWHATPGTGG